MNQIYSLSEINTENLKTLKCHIFSIKHSYFIICQKFGKKVGRIFKEEESIEILKVLGLIKNMENH